MKKTYIVILSVLVLLIIIYLIIINKNKKDNTKIVSQNDSKIIYDENKNLYLLKDDNGEIIYSSDDVEKVVSYQINGYEYDPMLPEEPLTANDNRRIESE